MNCQRAQDLLKFFLDGRLQGEVLRQVRKHIVSCPACRSGLNPQDMMEILPVLDESIEPSEDFSARFYSALDGRHKTDPEKRLQPASLKSARILIWSKGLVAAGVLAVLVAAGIYFRQSPYRIPDTSAVFYELEVTENLAFFEDMELIENLELFEDLDTIENLPQIY